ncbi:MAG: class I SAM-dependent methyltransferase [Gaiellaceae bacterium]
METPRGARLGGIGVIGGKETLGNVSSVAEEPGLVFDRVAGEYDRVRPGYPAVLIDQACERAGLGANSRVVEVGCGTGKLTVALAGRGLHIEATDPGLELLTIARRRLSGSSVRFHACRFEDAELPDSAFDAVFSATAFHWVDPLVGWAKVARLLRPGGFLALLDYPGGWSLALTRDLEPDAAIMAAWREVMPGLASSRDAQTIWTGAEARLGNVSELWEWFVGPDHEIATREAADLFTDVQYTSIPIEREETTEEAIARLRTMAAYLRLDSDRQRLLERRLTAIIADAGGTYRSSALPTLATARVAA